jgi:hypothetical protein
MAITNININTLSLILSNKRILSDLLDQKSIDHQMQRQLLNWYEGAPSSNIIAEIFLQNTENLYITNLTNKHSIVNYFRYVDVILIIFDPNSTNIQAILKYFNYLDFYIQKGSTSWITSIHRKSTFTGTVIPYTSNHPNQHKYAAIRFLYNRLNSYDFLNREYQHVGNIIHNIFYNRSFPINLQKPAYRKPEQRLTTQTPAHTWATLTYIGKETTIITNIFRRIKLKIAIRTNNTIQNLLKHKTQVSDKYASLGVYQV